MNVNQRSHLFKLLSSGMILFLSVDLFQYVCFLLLTRVQYGYLFYLPFSSS